MELILLPVNKAKQETMAAYMKHRFIFLGVAAPERQRLTKAMIKESKELSTEALLSLIASYYQLPEREYQYVAIDLAVANVQRLTLAEVLSLADYVSQKAWWDSVDAWRKVFSLRIKVQPDELLPIFTHFYESTDFWLRRVGINLQLMQKSATDVTLLTQGILKDRETDQFFIQKAIGWSLRQYSKTNPEWVKQFLLANELSPLAHKEASKHLD